MPRWLIALVSTVLGLPLLALAFAPFYVGTAVLGLRHPAWEWVYAVSTFVLLVAAIVALVKIQTTLMRWADASQAAHARARFDRELAALQADARRGHWASLAERYRRVDHDQIERWESRYQSLRADPRRHAFAERALYGEFPADHEIDYQLDPTARRTCDHLRPVEAALRDAGIPCAPLSGIQASTPSINTAAALDEPALRTRFSLPTFVEWQVELPEPHNPGAERLFCPRCTSSLESGGGPVFPAAA